MRKLTNSAEAYRQIMKETAYRYTRKGLLYTALTGVALMLFFSYFVLYPPSAALVDVMSPVVGVFIIFAALTYDAAKFEVILNDVWIERKGLLNRRAEYREVRKLEFNQSTVTVWTRERFFSS